MLPCPSQRRNVNQHQVYPDPTQAKLREALAKLHVDAGVTTEHVVAGAGSDDILDIIMRVTTPETIVISTPTFGMYTCVAASLHALPPAAARTPPPPPPPRPRPRCPGGPCAVCLCTPYSVPHTPCMYLGHLPK